MLARVMLASEVSGKAGTGASAHAGPETPTRASEGLERLALALGTISVALTPYQSRIVNELRAGSTLTRQRGGPWHLEHIDGSVGTVRGDSVQGMWDRGVLHEA